MSAVTIEEAKAKLQEILTSLTPGEQVSIMQNGEEIAKLTGSTRKQGPCQAGCYAKPEFWMAPDFNAPLEEFKEYMEC